MLRYLLLFFLLFTPLFLFYPPHSESFAPLLLLDEDWKFGQPGRSEFNGVYAASEKTAYFQNGSKLTGEERLALPFLGSGYFSYTPSGRSISFHAATGELFWKRDFRGYPVVHPQGQLALVLATDNNAVSVIDTDGFVRHHVEGVLLMDYRFADREPLAGLLFSDGRFVLAGVDQKRTGKVESQAFYFAKSLALSADAKLVAIHAHVGQEDLVTILRWKESAASFDRILQVPLSREYAHEIQMAVGEGGLLLALPDSTAFFNLDGQKLFERPMEKSGLYRPVLALSDFFVFGEGESVFVLDAAGRLLVVYARPPGPFQLLAGRDQGAFAEIGTASIVFRELSGK